jgi:hypothetical protein
MADEVLLTLLFELLLLRELLELLELAWLLELTVLLTLAALLVFTALAMGGLDLVPPLPPPQAVKANVKKLAIKTGLINLIIVSGIQTAPLLSCYRQNQKPISVNGYICSI